MKNIVALKLLILVFLLLNPLAGWSADFEEGMTAYLRGDYETALREWRPLAEQGVADAQHNLGVLYDDGAGVPQNATEAVYWYRKAAEQGFALAQYNLGVSYTNGRGVPQDDTTAVYWYRKAAEQGHADAQHNLGVMYVTGRGTAQDNVNAYMWWSIASSQGHQVAAEYRDRVAEQMTPSQKAKAQTMAQDWMQSR